MNASHSHAQRPRQIKSLLLASAGLLAGLILFSVPRTAQGSSSHFSVIRSDTQEPVASRIVQRNTGDSAALVVTQKEKTFLPATIEIHVGQTLEIVNEDTTLHNAYCSAGDFKYNSGPQQPGTKSTLTFTAAGSYEVRCAIHPKMRLAVTVAP